MTALNTYRATKQAVAYASGGSMIDIANDATTTVVAKVWRIYHFNNGTSAVTGVLVTMQIQRSTTVAAPTGGSTITPVLHDTNNTAVNSHLTCGSARTVIDAALLRQYIYSNDEPTVSASTMDEWELFVPFAEIWNAGYGDTNVQPLTARTSQGYHLKQSSASAVGTADVELEFSQE